jgi:hypothetical protein
MPTGLPAPGLVPPFAIENIEEQSAYRVDCTKGEAMTEEEKAIRLQRLNGAMDYITKHFAVISVVTAVIGATLAIIFIEA